MTIKEVIFIAVVGAAVIWTHNAEAKEINMSYMKVVEEKSGQHIWFKVFVTERKGLTMAKAGDLIFSEGVEADDARNRLKVFADTYQVITK